MNKRTLDYSELLSMKLDGMTYAAIAEAAGISRQRVQQLLAPPSSTRDSVVQGMSGCMVNTPQGS